MKQLSALGARRHAFFRSPRRMRPLVDRLEPGELIPNGPFSFYGGRRISGSAGPGRASLEAGGCAGGDPGLGCGAGVVEWRKSGTGINADAKGEWEVGAVPCAPRTSFQSLGPQGKPKSELPSVQVPKILLLVRSPHCHPALYPLTRLSPSLSLQTTRVNTTVRGATTISSRKDPHPRRPRPRWTCPSCRRPALRGPR